MLYKVESEKDIDQLGADLEQACMNHQFGVLGMHDLKEKMAASGASPLCGALGVARSLTHD